MCAVMTAVGRAMGEHGPRGTSAGEPTAVIEEHLLTLGCFAMALHR
jgi:hypothetical protein